MGSAIKTMADVLQELGGIPLNRILFQPPPGTATEQDVMDVEARGNRLCELVDGVLVEKPMGYVESILAGAILAYLREFVVPRNLGHVSGADGMILFDPGLVRIPDVAFTSWERFPGGRLPADPIPDLAPELAVEVISRTNTPAEMQRKRREYFSAGVRVVWMVDPRARQVTVYHSADQGIEVGEDGVLDGGNVLPGFSLAVGRLFSELDRQPE